MISTAIIYASTHHGNTLKLVKAIAEKHSIDLIDATRKEIVDLSKYDLIGFASGIDFGKLYQSIEDFMDKNLPENKTIFFIYTCAKPNQRFTNSVASIAKKKNANLAGEYGCKGYNTYGPWKIIGGMNKTHPNEKDITNAITFFESILDKIHSL